MIVGPDLNFTKELSTKTIKLGYDFSVPMQEKNNKKDIEIITLIEQLHTIW
jgi:hypothetical protein